SLSSSTVAVRGTVVTEGTVVTKGAAAVRGTVVEAAASARCRDLRADSSHSCQKNPQRVPVYSRTREEQNTDYEDDNERHQIWHQPTDPECFRRATEHRIVTTVKRHVPVHALRSHSHQQDDQRAQSEHTEH
ncbi:hypothetical protein PMAYCL1PPCAC_26091, partial [Pristionchus mayeri]